MNTVQLSMADPMAGPFVDMVTDDVAPNYRQYIPAPMCLRLILDRLKSGFYRQVAASCPSHAVFGKGGRGGKLREGGSALTCCPLSAQPRAVMGDLRLIRENCFEFNGPSSEISRMADALVSRLIDSLR